MNYPAASSGVSKTTTGKTLRPKGRGIHPDGIKSKLQMRYTATSIAAKDVIPAKAGIQKSTGFPRIKYGAGLVKPGMTNYIRLMSPCIKPNIPVFHHSIIPILVDYGKSNDQAED